MNRLLAIYGSPKERGRSDAALDILLENLKNKRAPEHQSTRAPEVEKVYIRNLNIKPCSGCLKCRKDGTCKIKDDMEKIIPSLISSDIIILSLPVYFKGLPSPLKAMIDRCQVLWERKIIRENKAKGFFILTCGKKEDFTGCIDVIRAFFTTSGAKLIDGTILADDEPLENILIELNLSCANQNVTH